jgi:ubiquinone/menaquinone biosynthesis C-methylase UbiE
MAEYQFSHAWQQERARLASLEQFDDPGTIRHLRALGIGPGWHCLEVGAGGGSIAGWLCERVGENGRVLATDLETKFLEALSYPNLEVRRHDITADPLPADAFDLIHERAVLIHVPEPLVVLARLVAALKPGGVLLCEDTDFASFVDGSPFAAVRKVGAAMVRFLESKGAAPNFGRHLFGALKATGLTNLGAEGRVYIMRGDHPSSVLPRFTFERVREPVIAAGWVTAADYDDACTILHDPETAVMSHIMMAAWGRRPRNS